MYTMMQACRKTDMTYQALKYYCNEGPVPNVKRNKNNRRIFDEHDVKWIRDLVCLKKCGMSINEMKKYLDLCLQGESTIPQRKEMLTKNYVSLLTLPEMHTTPLLFPALYAAFIPTPYMLFTSSEISCLSKCFEHLYDKGFCNLIDGIMGVINMGKFHSLFLFVGSCRIRIDAKQKRKKSIKEFLNVIGCHT